MQRLRNFFKQEKYDSFMLALPTFEKQVISLSDYNKVSTELVPQAKKFLEKMAHDPRRESRYQDIYFVKFLVSGGMTPELSGRMAKVRALLERDKKELLEIVDYFARRAWY